MKLTIDLSGARMFGRRFAFKLARRRAAGKPVLARPITVPRPRADHQPASARSSQA
jgi:hypothetical protein